MSAVWDKLEDCQHRITELLDKHCSPVEDAELERFNQPENGWINLVWSSKDVRRAHVDVVDARSTKRPWMMHVCVFPVLDNNSPIYGFDVIAGENKITGAFHDFSQSSGPADHALYTWYEDTVADYIPTKARKLPEWAENIFSPSMIAAGNVSKEDEIDNIVNYAVENLEVYLESLAQYSDTADRTATANAQDYYCENQQQNPHTPRVMKSLGLSDEDVEIFCKDVLFPKIT
jgi:hypothetical protein